MKPFILLIIIGFSWTLKASEKAPANIAAGINSILTEEETRRTKLESDLRDLMAEIQNIDVNDQNVDVEMSRIESQLKLVKSDMAENQLRIDFLNAFLSSIDRTQEPLKKLSVVLLDLSHRQVTSAVQNSTESKLWLFELYLSMALKSFFEPSENLGLFVKQYLSYSSISDPKSPRGFGKSREYLSLKEDKEDDTGEVPEVERKPSKDLPTAAELVPETISSDL